MKRLKLIRNVRLGIKSLWLHKLRSVLTMLGVVFGVGSVVAMLSVGEGASQKALEQIRKLGSDNIIIHSIKPTEEEKESSRSTGRSRTLDYGLRYEDLARIRQSYPAVKRAVPAKIIREEARLGERATEVRIVGTTPGWFDLVPRELVAGRVLNEGDMAKHAGVCVLGEDVARRLLAGESTIGQTVRIGEDSYFVVGILKTATGAGGGVQTPDRSNDAYIPLNVVKERIGDTVVQRSSGSFSRENVELHQIIVEVGPTDVEVPRASFSGFHAWMQQSRRVHLTALQSVEPTARAIEIGLNRFHDRKDFDVAVPLALLRQARETQRIFNIVLGSIAGISLLVGGIGIMNIMLASVTERTREIGVRRAIGAKRRQIITQFLIETVVLSSVGGLFGVGLGVTIPALIQALAGMPTVVTWWSVLLSLGISGFVGIVFGLYPAFRAATLDPIVALRHE